MKILIVEDDNEIAKLIKLYLSKEGYETVIVDTASMGLKKFYEESFDLIVLDLMLPDFSGIKALKEIKKEKDIPIVIITAKGEEDDKIIGFKEGADDYITKPFSFKELVLRIKAILKRYGDKDIIQYKDLKILPKEYKIFKNDVEIKLSTLEFKIFMALYKKRGSVVSRDEMLDSIYGFYGEPVIDRNVDVHIVNLRKKLKDNFKKPKYIETIRGVGYRLVTDEN